MRKFQEKNKFKLFMQSKPVLFILTVIVLLFGWKIISMSFKLKETYKNKKIEQQKIIDLSKRKEKLYSDIEKLNTEEGKEELIRENFGLVKDGENVIVVVEEKNQPILSSEKEKKDFFGFLKNIFKK